jgi:hypothetical protein
MQAKKLESSGKTTWHNKHNNIEEDCNNNKKFWEELIE